MWGQAPRPQVLIAETGGLVGVMTETGRALSKQKGSGFVAGVWLENDGDAGDQVQAAARWPGASDGIQRFRLGPTEVVHLTGKRAASGFDECKAGQVIVAPVALDLRGDCGLFDVGALGAMGSLAINQGKIISAAQISGPRLWSPGRSAAGKDQ